jgi:hypothetical protein
MRKILLSLFLFLMAITLGAGCASEDAMFDGVNESDTFYLSNSGIEIQQTLESDPMILSPR